MIGEASAKAKTISRRKKSKTIQYGNTKLETHARLFSQTLAHGKSKNEIRQKKTEEERKRGASMERNRVGTKKGSPGGISLPNKNLIITMNII